VLKIKPPDYKFCPFCGRKLQIKIEEEKERKYCSICDWTYYPHAGVAVGAVILKKGKVLMVKRRREPYKERWMFPAGFVDFGEHPLEALEREVKEETGLKVKKAKLIKILQSEDDPRTPGHFVFFYKVQVLRGRVRTDEEENIDIAWVDIMNPPKMGWKTHKYIMRKLQKQTS